MAKLIVRKPSGEIQQMLDLSSLDERNVQRRVAELRACYPYPFTIDQSQIEAARAASRARAA